EQRAAIPTWAVWRDIYLDGVRRRKKQPRHDEGYLSPQAEAKKRGRKKGGAPHPVAVVAERWKHRPITDIERGDVQAAMNTIAERGHTTANRWLAAVRACF